MPSGLFNWLGAFNQIPDSYVLNHQSLDGYLLLRFLKIATVICFVGCLITWPILFPVNATGGGGQNQLNLLSFSNVTGNKYRYLAHTFIAWIFICKSRFPSLSEGCPGVDVDANPLARFHFHHDHKRVSVLHQPSPSLSAFSLVRLEDVVTYSAFHLGAGGVLERSQMAYYVW